MSESDDEDEKALQKALAASLLQMMVEDDEDDGKEARQDLASLFPLSRRPKDEHERWYHDWLEAAKPVGPDPNGPKLPEGIAGSAGYSPIRRLRRKPLGSTSTIRMGGTGAPNAADFHQETQEPSFWSWLQEAVCFCCCMKRERGFA
eukprot:s2682_g8.t1